MKDKIIDYIKRNRVSTTEIADCLGKTGSILNVVAVNRGHFAVGELFYVYAINETNWDVHEQIQLVPDNAVVFVDVVDGKAEKAVFGDLVSKYLLLYRQVSAVVTNGALRDAPQIIRENWKVWCNGFNPVGYSNEFIELTFEQVELVKNKSTSFNGSVAVCDDTGVVIIPGDNLNENFLSKIQKIEEQEDTWFDCIDRKKMSTFETVCLKNYEDTI